MSNQDVIPSHLSGIPYDDGGKMNNILLRMGEVQATYSPTHRDNISKRANEYDVLVSHYDNGTAVTRIYPHCFVQDMFGGVADTLRYTLRADKSGYRTPLKPGLGSKVLIQCISGHENSAVIVGGIKDMAAPKDRAEDGHNLLFRFNGIEATINKDGELIIERQGPQEMDGQLKEGEDENASGSTISFLRNGNIEIADAVKDGDKVVSKNLVLMDHAKNKIEITGDAEVNINSKKVTFGSDDATEPFPLGNKLVSILGDLIDAIDAITVMTAFGPSGPVINIPSFLQIKAQLNTILSQVTYSK